MDDLEAEAFELAMGKAKNKSGDIDDLAAELIWMSAISFARSSQPQQVPAGWKLVPAEPTEEMLDADFEVYTVSSGLNYSANRKNMWRSMFNAAPPSPTTGWMPIETAPKDGTTILGYWPQFFGSEYSSPYAVAKCIANTWINPDDEEVYSDPPYWMPLPPALKE